ncbi:MAG TPA: DNA translocase FtsK 4TM domain-containing protein [Tenuifilaceae bacterium]|nr:DNA translocase FtsK 4TM domain-containing protein [Tenuifilaceae bacterium]HPI44428.1 DNA translocase FtsK 4TM domain-containing protein [Tenuifilaceae bacterium]HPN21701.1 DNA translocase FtsK 4TM domain-containing protein [Tenuifilaceae bacterium]
MAKEKTNGDSNNGKESKEKQNTNTPEKKSFFKDERVRFTIGLFTLLLSIYITIAFVSYLFTWKVDQSFEWQNLFSGSDIRVKNWTGKLGASISAQFMHHWFGVSSLAFPLIFAVFGLKLLKLYSGKIWKLTFKVVVGVVLFSLITGFLFGTAHGFLGSGLGGAHGLFIAEWISAILGKVGTAFLLLLLLIAYTIYIKPSSLFWYNRITWDIAQYIKNFTKKTDIPDVAIEEPSIESPINVKEEIDEEEEYTPPTAVNSKKYEPTIAEKPLLISDIDDNDNDEALVFEENDFEVETKPAKEIANSHITQTVVKADDEGSVEFTIETIEEKELNEDAINEQEMYDPTLELSHYQRPLVELLEDYKNNASPVTNEALIENKNKIVETLSHYKIQIDKIKATIGPTVTLYEIVPAPGIRISKIKNLEDDIALSLAALGIRIIAPIPGRGTIGIEVPNQHPEIVSMHSIIKSQKFQESKFELTIALGKTISNEIFMLDLTKLPHLLVAGATGQGKSVGLNAIITSLLYKKHPAEIKFVLVDPKKVELTLYSKLEKHFLAKLPDSEDAIITDTQKVINTLNSLCIEMDQRYELLKLAQVRNIKEYNDKFVSRRLNPHKGHKFLPYIVVIIDEFADLIMTAGREVEMPIARIAQLARAIGIHLIIATQRPSTNIITGVIKANFPARIAFRVSSMIDSRTILDHPGANHLIGRGDMLVSAGSDMIRVQCAFIDIPEIERITDFVSNQQGYSTAFQLPEYVPESQDVNLEVDLRKRDELFEDAARLVVQSQMGSTSLIQRKFSIGYNRAGRIVDQLEAAGIVGPFEGSKARQVLIVDEMSLEQLLKNISSQ